MKVSEMEGGRLHGEIRKCKYRLRKVLDILVSLDDGRLRKKQKWQLISQDWVREYLNAEKARLETRIESLKEESERRRRIGQKAKVCTCMNTHEVLHVQ